MLFTRCSPRSALCSSRRTATGLHYPIPLHLQNAYKSSGYKNGDFPISENVASEIISLPMYPGLSYEEQKEVADKIKQFLTSN